MQGVARENKPEPTATVPVTGNDRGRKGIKSLEFFPISLVHKPLKEIEYETDIVCLVVSKKGSRRGEEGFSGLHTPVYCLFTPVYIVYTI